MKQISLLLQAYFRQDYGKGGKVTAKKVWKFIGISLLVLYLAGIMSFIFYQSAQLGVVSKVYSPIFSMLMMQIQSITIIFGAGSLVRMVYLSKDKEMLASLPVTKSHIFISKFIYTYVHQFLLALVIGIGPVIVLGVVGKFGVVYYLLGTIGIVIAPILAMVVASIIILPILGIVSFTRKKPVVSGILLMLIYGGVFVLYFGFIFSLSSNQGVISPEIADMLNNIGSKLFFNTVYADIIFGVGNTLYNILMTIAIYGGGIVVTIFINNLIYKSSFVNNLEGAGQIVATVDYRDKGGITSTLMSRDLKSITRSTGMQMNMFIGFLIMPIVVGALIYFQKSNFEELGAEFANAMVFSISGMVLYQLSGTNYLASTALTRENNNAVIFKVLPLSTYQIYISKLLTAVIPTIISMSVTLVVMSIISGNVLISLFVVLSAMFIGVGTNALQVYSDMNNPKIGWTNFNKSLKNSPRILVPMLILLAIGILLLILIVYMSVRIPNFTLYAFMGMTLLSAIYAIIVLKSCIAKSKVLVINVE